MTYRCNYINFLDLVFQSGYRGEKGRRYRYRCEIYKRNQQSICNYDMDCRYIYSIPIIQNVVGFLTVFLVNYRVSPRRPPSNWRPFMFYLLKGNMKLEGSGHHYERRKPIKKKIIRSGHTAREICHIP